MTSDEYKDFMDKQIAEIEEYTSSHRGTNHNDCVLEWVEKYASDFRTNWMDTEHNLYSRD